MISKRLTIALVCLTLVLGAAAPTAASPLSSTAAVANIAPTVTDIDLPASVSPVAGSTKSVSLTVTVADDNGWQDLVEVRVSVTDPGGGLHTAQSPATSNEDGSGVAKTYGHSFDLQYYDQPGLYKVAAVAEDAKGAVSTTFEATFTYEELAALAVQQSALDFGTVDPGTRSATSELTVENQGNVAIDLETSGTPLVHEGGSAQIATDRVRYDLESDAFANETGLTETPFVNQGFGLQPGSASTAGTWWALETPSGEDQYVPGGSYEGTLTVSAVQA